MGPSAPDALALRAADGPPRYASASQIPEEALPLTLTGVWDGDRHFYSGEGLENPGSCHRRHWLTFDEFVAKYRVPPPAWACVAHFELLGGLLSGRTHFPEHRIPNPYPNRETILGIVPFMMGPIVGLEVIVNFRYPDRRMRATFGSPGYFMRHAPPYSPPDADFDPIAVGDMLHDLPHWGLEAPPEGSLLVGYRVHRVLPRYPIFREASLARYWDLWALFSERHSEPPGRTSRAPLTSARASTSPTSGSAEA